jgi:hypothetical protein
VMRGLDCAKIGGWRQFWHSNNFIASSSAQQGPSHLITSHSSR